MRAFTLVEMLLVVALIAGLMAIATAAYKRAKWSAKVVQMSAENRGRLNQAVSEGKFRSQRKFEQEQARQKRMMEQGLKQGN